MKEIVPKILNEETLREWSNIQKWQHNWEKSWLPSTIKNKGFFFFFSGCFSSSGIVLEGRLFIEAAEKIILKCLDLLLTANVLVEASQYSEV